MTAWLITLATVLWGVIVGYMLARYTVKTDKLLAEKRLIQENDYLKALICKVAENIKLKEEDQ